MFVVLRPHRTIETGFFQKGRGDAIKARPSNRDIHIGDAEFPPGEDRRASEEDDDS